jgi:hypothetical protein
MRSLYMKAALDLVLGRARLMEILPSFPEGV